jgi:hypothetical protein
MFTANQARALFANVTETSPERWPAAVQTLIVDALNTNEKLLRALVALNAEVKALRGEALAAPAAESAPVVPAPVSSRKRDPNMDPQQAAVEDMMDAAIAAEESQKAAAAKAAPPAPQPPPPVVSTVSSDPAPAPVAPPAAAPAPAAPTPAPRKPIIRKQAANNTPGA